MRQTISLIRKAAKEHNTPAFKAGLLLLIINPVIGWVGMPLAITYFSLHNQVRRGVLIGTGIYAFSWILLGSGILLAGKPGYRISKLIWYELRERFRSRRNRL